MAGDTLDLGDDDDWLFEIKGLTGTKERIQLSIGSILVGTSYPELGDFETSFPTAYQVIQEFGQPLLPVLARPNLNALTTEDRAYA